MSETKFISVTAINRYINYKFEQDINLQEVYLEGEISNFKYSGKHCYFSLKDQNSEISAMFFFPYNQTLKFSPKDGMSVQVVGKIQVYQKKGTYAIIVTKMAETGVGLLYQEFLDLKDKLAKEGLFDESKKLELPQYPNTVAIITAPTGEAIHDIISTFNRRLPLAKLKLYPALVQGQDAPKDLIRALNLVYRDNDADVIIIGRGGGSFEDLSCFNDEALVRLLASSAIPTISAVGHEGDYTICDFVASYRAPTPTGAAMKLTKERSEVLNQIITSSNRIKVALKNKLIAAYNDWNSINNSYGLSMFDKILEQKEVVLNNTIQILEKHSPTNIIREMSSTLDNEVIKLKNAIENELNFSEYMVSSLDARLNENLVLNKINSEKLKLESLIEKVILLNPFNIMKKGYSIIYKDEKIISCVNELEKNDKIVIKMIDGIVSAKVE